MDHHLSPHGSPIPNRITNLDCLLMEGDAANREIAYHKLRVFAIPPFTALIALRGSRSLILCLVRPLRALRPLTAFAVAFYTTTSLVNASAEHKPAVYNYVKGSEARRGRGQEGLPPPL